MEQQAPQQAPTQSVGVRRAQELAAAAAARIARIAPPGLGAWPEVWQRVSAADTAATDALEQLREATGDRSLELAQATDTAERACDALALAWQKATLAWIAAGQPMEMPENTAKHPASAAPLLEGQVHTASADNDLEPPVPDLEPEATDPEPWPGLDADLLPASPDPLEGL